MRLTRLDDIEALHMEQQNRKPDAPDNPPQRDAAAHRSTMVTASDMQVSAYQSLIYQSLGMYINADLSITRHVYRS